MLNACGSEEAFGQFGFKLQLGNFFFIMASSPTAPPNDADTNLALEMLARANLPHEQVAHLRAELEKAKKPKRKDMQDYSMFALYLTDKLWQKALNSKEDQMSVLDAVVSYLAEKLGLRCPHELTQGTLCGLLVCTMDDEEKEKHKQPTTLRAFFLTVKSRVSSRLSKFRHVQLPADYMTVLPSCSDELPAAYRQEFSPPKVPLADILSVANDIVYRKNGKLLQAKQIVPDPLQTLLSMPFVAGLMASFQQMSMSQPELPLHMISKPKHAVQSLLDRASPSCPAPAPTALALEDKPADKPVVKPAEKQENLDIVASSSVASPGDQAPAVPPPPVTLEESMDRLKAATIPAKSEASPTKGMKRPASASIMKKPAQKPMKQAKKQPTASSSVKRPASKMKAVVSKATVCICFCNIFFDQLVVSPLRLSAWISNFFKVVFVFSPLRLSVWTSNFFKIVFFFSSLRLSAWISIF